MNCRHTGKHKKKGIALVITLVMLAVVTVMAIVFLAVTRRERGSVIVTQETAIAKDMADAALERAKTEAMAKMNASGSRLNYDIFNSTVYYSAKNANFNNPLGVNSFEPGNSSPTNVAHPIFWPNMPTPNFLRNLANLQHDAPVPVFVTTNENTRPDFRFYLDFNRNRQFESNYVGYGIQPGQLLTNVGRFLGDPEWIGMLERPDFPHSETNRFVGRLAYLALPAGKSLDLNFMHNQVRQGGNFDDLRAGGNGFSRGQGVGSWEINLAAFFRELNTNQYAWPANTYSFTLNNGIFDANGFAFDDARSVLAFRYMDQYGASRARNLDSMYKSLGYYNLLNPGQQQNDFTRAYVNNYVEDFSRRPFLGNNGSLFFPPAQAPLDSSRDTPLVEGWPGSVNTNAYTDVQQLFSVDTTSPGFVARLTDAARRNAAPNSGISSYDRYTVYRLLSQLGTDSTPDLEGKLHLNFKNAIGSITNQTERWVDNASNAVMFFTNAAELMLKASIDGKIDITNETQIATYRKPRGTYYLIGDTLIRTNEPLVNVQIYARDTNPSLRDQVFNEYTPTIHRIFQLAANIFDSMTNRTPALPTAFLPIFTNTLTNISISGWVEVGPPAMTNNVQNLLVRRPWTDPETAFTNSFDLRLYNLFGQHVVLGAKKGHPNFNELALNSRVEFSRKLSFRKDSTASTNIIATNQMFILGLEQRWGLEAWNSYTQANNRSMSITGVVVSTIALRDSTNRLADGRFLLPPVYYNTVAFTGSANVGGTTPWGGRPVIQTAGADRSLLTLIDETRAHINERSYTTAGGLIGTNRLRGITDADYSAALELPPQFVLYTTNKVRYWAIDEATGRLVDFVSFDRLVTEMDLREKLRENQNLATGTNNNRISYWDTNLVAGSSAITVGVSNQIAVSVGELQEPIWRPYRYNGVDKVGSISKFRAWMGLPLRTGIDTNLQPHQVPQGIQLQVPFTPTRQFVQRMSWQVNDPLVHYMWEDLRRDRVNEGPQVFDNVDDRVVNRTNQWNIGLRNKMYHPWSGKENLSEDPYSWSVGLMDPGVRSSDHWDFMPRYTNVSAFPNIGWLGQVHRGTPWQTIYLKSIYYIDRNSGALEFTAHPTNWVRWAGSIGTHPMRDWRLLDVFTTAANENAASGLLSVNQTNTAAWSAVLSGGIAATNTTRYNVALQNQNRGVDPVTAYAPWVIQPGSPQISDIVQSINFARTNQIDIIPNPDPNANANLPYIPIWRTNVLAQKKAEVFRSMGEVVSAPALSVQSPFLNRDLVQVRGVWTDRAVEYIPQQILSLLRKDEPRFVVYAFGQSLKPAPRSLTTDPDFYHMCTNYQITGEVITKTTFRVEGSPMDAQNPLRPVVEKYEILPPLE